MNDLSSPHNIIIKRLGGIGEVSRKMTSLIGRDVSRSTIQGWWEREYIPVKHHQNILKLGGFLTPPILATDFFESENKNGQI